MYKYRICIIILLLLLTACAPAVVEQAPAPEPTSVVTPEQTTASEDKKANVKVTFLTLADLTATNEKLNITEYARGLSDAVKESGVEYETVHIEHTDEGYQASIDKAFENIYNNGIDKNAVVLDQDLSMWIMPPNSAQPSVFEKEIPIIQTFFADPADFKQKIEMMENTFCFNSNEYSCGEVLADYCAKALDGKTGTFVFWASDAMRSSSCVQIDSFKEKWDIIKDTYELDNVYIKFDYPCWGTDNVERYLKEEKTKTPDLIGISSFESDYLGQGFSNSCAEFEDLSETLIIDAYSSEEDLALLSEGVIDAIIEPPYYEMGYQAGLAAVRALKGEEVEKFTEVPYTMITEETL